MPFNLILSRLWCRDAGFDCDVVFKRDTQDEIMANAGEHAMKEHDIKAADTTPELKEKIRGLIYNS